MDAFDKETLAPILAQASEQTRLALALASLLRPGENAAPLAGSLALHYQPQVYSSDDNVLLGVEALLRWNHPELGCLEPARVLPLAEEAGLTDALTRWVLGAACRQLVDWRARDLPMPRMAVNLPSSSFTDSGLPLLLAQTLRTYGLHPTDLLVEVIEADILPRHPALLTTARAVHEQGIELAWDGFGPASLASLSALRPDTQPEALADLTDLLRPLPFAELKLDCGLVDGRTQAFVNTALRLGRNLGRRVVAHKVEHEAQQQFLVEHGCQYLQGHRIARPLPARALERWLAAQGIWPILATR